MMEEVASAITAAKGDSKRVVRIEVPIPVTGGTELDDWPGGIRQKFFVLEPMISETLKKLGFSADEIKKRTFIDEEADAVYIWDAKGYQLVTFPLPDTIPNLAERVRWNDDSSILAIVNQQFFLDPMSKQESKDFQEAAEVCYILENLNMRGPGAMPVRGLVYRKYPGPFQYCRRLDGGGYVLLKEVFDGQMPPRDELEELFFNDSKERDKDLSFVDRLKRQVPNFGNK